MRAITLHFEDKDFNALKKEKKKSKVKRTWPEFVMTLVKKKKKNNKNGRRKNKS